MSRVDRALGLARSLAVYHLIPRQRQLRALYAPFVSSGDLVFDVGAHVGNRTRAFAALGCRVVAVEPQPHVAAVLRAIAPRLGDVTVVEAAVGEATGRATLAISERNPTVSTLSTAWRDQRRHEHDFAGVRWSSAADVEVVTLDALIARHGEPAFIKIDIEGGEEAALRGLTRAVRAVSFEYLPRALEAVTACVGRLSALGRYTFTWAHAESHRLASDRWLDGDDFLATFQSAGLTRHGDVYARLASARPS